MKILVVNAGSSSLKYQLIDMDGEVMLVKGQVERIGIEGGHLKQTVALPGQDKKVIEIFQPIENHVEATQMMLKALQDPEKGAIKSVIEIGAVGHRVLHGGTKFSASVV
ncbi:MAG: acetate kinase, partial [Selenomonadaceae bacterium]|nr:acetate kinase [Selenomonadaceae bacterium]